jgi:S1-C subfamily serine protease
MMIDLAKLGARLDRAFGQAPPNTVLSRVRAIVGSDSAMPSTEEGRLAVEGYRRLKNGEAPTPKQLSALQFLLRLTRPAPLVHQGKPDTLPTTEHLSTFPNWTAFQTAAACLRLVGRIDRASPTPATAESIGTGLLVAPGFLVTNKHVLADLSRGTDVLEPGQAVVRFDWEDGAFAADMPVSVTGVGPVHPSLDVALLKLAGSPAPPASPAATFDEAPIADNADVVVVGYPLDDKDRNPMFIRNIFGTAFGVLRAAPGQCTSSSDDGFYHDCSTLGGNSGSPVFALDTARVVGLHSGGGFLWKNAAVAAAAIVPFVRDATR